MAESSSSRASRLVIQPAHGFRRGNAVRFDGTDWEKAVAGQSGIRIVGSIRDANTFEAVQSGYLEGLFDLTPGSTYFLSEIDPGEWTTDATSTQLFEAHTTTAGFVDIVSTTTTIEGVGDVDYSDTYAPIEHTHEVTEIDGIDEYILSLFVAGPGIEIEASPGEIRVTHITPLATIDADYTIDALTDATVLADATSGAIAVTLPDVTPATQQVFTIKKVDSSANAVTITPASGTLDGEANFVIDDQYEAISVQTDGTNWFIVYRCPAPSLGL